MKKSVKRIYAAVICAMTVLVSGCGAKNAQGNSEISGMTTSVSSQALPSVVLYTTDVHCSVDMDTENGISGYEGVMALKNKYEESGYDVALVDSGDAIQGEALGTITKGGDIIDIMNEMGYTAMALGNHEFDYGVERLKELSDAADFPMLSLNFVDSEGKPVFKSYVIKELGNRKIAFIGISTPKTLTSSTPTYFMDDNGNYIYSFLQDETGNKLWDAVQNTVDEAKADGADMVIALTHLGIESSYAPYDASELIANTTGIDAVLDGHAHIETQMEEIKNKNGEDVLFSSAGYKNEKIGVLTISPEGELSAELKEVTDKDTDFEEYLKKIEADYTDRLNEEVAENDFDLIMNDPVTGVRLIRNQETNLGDFCADAYLYAAKKAGIDADIALVNGGGIRAELLSGSITYGDILSVFPYGNVLSVIKATGTQIRDALEISAAYAPEESGGFEQVAGISYTIDETMPSCVKFDSDGAFCGVDGEYRVSDIKVNGQDLDLNREYTVVSHDYLIKSGGDGINVFMNDEFILEDFTDDYEVLTDYINYVNNSGNADYSNEEGMGRITIKAE